MASCVMENLSELYQLFRDVFLKTLKFFAPESEDVVQYLKTVYVEEFKSLGNQDLLSCLDFAYCRPDLSPRWILCCPMCCPAHLKGKVFKRLELEGIKPVCRNSHGYDEALVLVAGGMRPSKRRHTKKTCLK